MAHIVEGNATQGFRVIDESGPLSGRKSTEVAALAAAGIKAEVPKPAKKAAAKKVV